MKRRNRVVRILRAMGATRVPDSPVSSWVQSLVLGFSVALAISVGGCTDRFTNSDPAQIGHLSLAMAFPEGTSQQAAFLDAWHVQVVRAGEGVIAEDQGSIGPSESEVDVDFTVDLNSSCETMTVRVELASSGEVWFRSNDNHEICISRENRIQVAQLQWVRPQASVTPGTLNFIVQERETDSQGFSINYGGVDGLVWAASIQDENLSWLSLQPSGGAIQGGQPAQVQVTVDAGTLDPGQYSASIVVTGEGFPEPIAEIPVTLEVTAGPGLGLSTTGLAFVVTGELTPDPQSFVVTNSGGGILVWGASDDASWVALEPAAGSLGPGESKIVAVLVNPVGLSLGSHDATITVLGEDAENSPQTIAVSLTKLRSPEIGLSATSLSFTAAEGSSPPVQYFTVSNAGGGLLNWSASDDVGWLELVPNTGTLGPGLGQQVTAIANSEALAIGTYTATITITDPTAANSPQTVAVSLTVSRSPEIGLSAKSLSFTAAEGGSPPAQYFTVSNDGGGLLNWSASDDAEWLTLVPNMGTLGPGLDEWVTVAVNSVALSLGTHTATITITDPMAVNSPRILPVTLTLTPSAPPTISDFVWDELEVNDTTCGNMGTRFELYFDYVDQEGDVLLAGDSLAGKPIGLDWWFRPDGNKGSSVLTGAVDGTGFAGSVTFQMCIAYQPKVNTSIDLTIRLRDAGNRLSNALFVNIPRPDGGNAPPPGGVSSVVGGGGGPGPES